MPDPEPDRKEGASSSHLVEWLRTLPALITAVTALVTAVAALRKPADDTPARLTYQELSKVIVQLAEASQQNHQDMLALRNFLEGYIRATQGQGGGRLLERSASEGAAAPGRRPDDESRRSPDRTRPGVVLPKPRGLEGTPMRPVGQGAGSNITSPPPGDVGSERPPEPTAPMPGGAMTAPARVPLQLPKLAAPRQLARPLPYRELLQKPEELFK